MPTNIDNNREFSVFQNATNPKPIGQITLDELYGVIKGGDHPLLPDVKGKVENYRQKMGLLSKGNDAVKNLKRSLPAVALAGIFKARKNGAMVEGGRSGYMVLDVDNLDGAEEIEKVAQIFKSEPSTTMVFVSPSNNGLKVIVDVGVDIPIKTSGEVLKHYYKVRGVELDDTFDEARLCFLSYDPDVYYRRSTEPFNVKDEMMEMMKDVAKKKGKGPRKGGNSERALVKHLIERVGNIGEGERVNTLCSVMGKVVGRHQLNEEVARRVVWEVNLACCEPPLEEDDFNNRVGGGARRFVENDEEKGARFIPEGGEAELEEGRWLVNPKDSQAIAKDILNREFAEEVGGKEYSTIFHTPGLGIVIYTDEGWKVCSKIHLANLVRGILPRGWVAQTDKEGITTYSRCTVTRALKDAVVDAIIELSNREEPPEDCQFIDRPDELNVNLLPLKNCVVDLASLNDEGEVNTLQYTSKFYTVGRTSYDYDPDAQCPTWEAFLESIWGDDRESIDVLEEWMAYSLTQNKDFEAILVCIGPPRSGKGVISTVMGNLGGKEYVNSFDFQSLEGAFGLANFIGKRSSIAPDVVQGGESIKNKLLSISGNDDLEVNIKYRGAQRHNLKTKVSIFTNRPLSFKDSSGSMADRYVTLTTKRSFKGQEDTTLKRRLGEESSGVLNRLIVAYKRLLKRGRFIQTKSGQAIQDLMRETSSPVGEFLDNCCEFGEDYSVTAGEFFHAYQDWHYEIHHNSSRPLGRNTFLKELVSCGRGINTERKKIAGKVMRLVTGVKLAPSTEDDGAELDF